MIALYICNIYMRFMLTHIYQVQYRRKRSSLSYINVFLYEKISSFLTQKISKFKINLLGSCFDYFFPMVKSFFHATLYMLCSHLAILKVLSKMYTSIFHRIAQGMYNYRFSNDFTINSS
jgi:hypothetical protein